MSKHAGTLYSICYVACDTCSRYGQILSEFSLVTLLFWSRLELMELILQVRLNSKKCRPVPADLLIATTHGASNNVSRKYLHPRRFYPCICVVHGCAEHNAC